MTLTALLMLATPGLPLAMLLACAWRPLRERMLPWLALGALPGLAAAFLCDWGEMIVLGNTRFPLAFMLDRPGAALLGVAALLWFAGGWYAATYQGASPDRGRFAACWLMTLAGCLGIFVVADMVTFYALLALLSIGTTGLVMQTGTPRSLRAGAIYIGMALLAESLLLIGFVLIVNSAPGNTLLIGDAPAAIVASPWRDAIFLCLLAGFGIKAGLVPLHFWIPLAHGAAPVPASALLSGAVVKASVIGLIRFMPLDSSPWGAGAALAAVGLLGALYAVVIGVTQRHPKTVLAYSSVSQMGVIVAIVGMGMAVGDQSAGVISAFYATNHVLSKGALFMAVGLVSATGSKRLWMILLPTAVLAIGLGGLPLSGGALTKAVAKNLLGDGPAGVLATLSAIGTTLLMLHFMRCLKAFAAKEPEAGASARLIWPWAVMVVAALVVPWSLFLFSSKYSLPDALDSYALWAALWPIAVGVVLSRMLVRWKRKLPELPEGDVVVALERAGRWLSTVIGTLMLRLDGALRGWTVASLSLLSLVLLFGLAILAAR